jgi:hypothetical protein
VVRQPNQLLLLSVTTEVLYSILLQSVSVSLYQWSLSGE